MAALSQIQGVGRSGMDRTGLALQRLGINALTGRVAACLARIRVRQRGSLGYVHLVLADLDHIAGEQNFGVYFAAVDKSAMHAAAVTHGQNSDAKPVFVFELRVMAAYLHFLQHDIAARISAYSDTTIMKNNGGDS